MVMRYDNPTFSVRTSVLAFGETESLQTDCRYKLVDDGRHLVRFNGLQLLGSELSLEGLLVDLDNMPNLVHSSLRHDLCVGYLNGGLDKFS